MDFLDFLAFGIWEKEITMSIIGHDCFYSMYLGGEMRQNGKDPIKRKKEKKKKQDDKHKTRLIHNITVDEK